MGLLSRPKGVPRSTVVLETRLRHAFDNWMKVLLPKSTEVDVIMRLDKFVALRDYFTNDGIGPIFIEKGMAQQFMDALLEASDLDTLGCLLFTISDLLDIDNSEVVCRWFENHGLVEFLIKLLRRSDVAAAQSISLSGQMNPSSANNPPVTAILPAVSRDTSRLKAACICALSSMTSFSFYAVTEAMDRREIDLLNNILQLKSMMSLHSRCIIFINNLYVSNRFVDMISKHIIPSVMTLLMYNVTNHIKLIKKRIQDNIAKSQQQNKELHDEKRKLQQQLQQPPQAPPASTASSETAGAASSSPSEENSDSSPNQSSSTPTGTHQASVVISGTESPRPDQSHEQPSKPTAATHDQVDKMYNDSLYVDFIASACILLGNLTTNYENCLVAESYSVIDIMTLLFHNSNDHNTPEVLANVVKCLANLATIPANHSKLRKSNILSMTIRLFLAPRLRMDLRAHLVLLLANMVGSEGANALLIDRGVIFALSSFLLDITNPHPSDSVTTGIRYDTYGYYMYEDPRFQRFGALMVANLSSDEEAVPFLVEAGIPSTMVNLCYSEHADVQRQAVRALYELSSYRKGLLVDELESYETSKALQHVINSELVRMVVDPASPSTSGSAPMPSDPTKSTPTEPHRPTIDDSTEPTSESTTSSPTAGSGTRPKGIVLPISSVELLAVSALAHIKTVRKTHTDTENNSKPSTSPLTHSTGVETSTAGVTPVADAASEALLELVNQEKSKGNEHFNARRWNDAISCYSRAIELNPTNVTLFSNRSAAYTQLGQFQAALLDAERCVELQRDWVKGHFRRGKALMGLHKYSDAIISLKEALNCEVGSREIQEALRTSVAKAREAEASYVNPDLCHLNASAIVQLFKQILAQNVSLRVPITLFNPQGGQGKKMEIGIEHVTQLLMQLLDLLKAYYDPTSTESLQNRLLGDTEPEEIGLELHDWAARVNIAQLMQAKGMDYVLFHLDMVSPCLKRLAKQHPDDELLWYSSRDLSCYQFGFFVTTILTRLVLEAHNHYGIGALKRIIQLNSDRLSRLSIGTPLSQATMQVTGLGLWGLPKMPWLRQLFLANGGVRCMAMDALGQEKDTYDDHCLTFLQGISPLEWLSMPQDQLDAVLEWTVLPAFDGGSPSPSLHMVAEIWANLFAIPGTRHNLPHYIEKFPKSDFLQFVLHEIPSAQFPPPPIEAGTPPSASPEARNMALGWAKAWLKDRLKS